MPRRINALDIGLQFSRYARTQIASPVFKQSTRSMHSRKCSLFIIFRRKESPSDDRGWFTAELNE